MRFARVGGRAWGVALALTLRGCGCGPAHSVPPGADDEAAPGVLVTNEVEDELDGSAPVEPSRVMATWPWPGPHCFAYSPRLSSYACVHLYAKPAQDSSEDADVSSASMVETLAGVQAKGARIQLGVSFVSAHGRRNHDVIDTVSPWREPPPESVAKLRERLRRRGYTEPVGYHAELPEDTWVDVGRVQLRYSVHLHEGDASFEYSGTLEIRCDRTAPAQTIDFDPYDDLGGPFAVVASAPGTSLHAVTVEHQDGGEGYVDLSWSSWLVDEREWCPDDIRGSPARERRATPE